MAAEGVQKDGPVRERAAAVDGQPPHDGRSAGEIEAGVVHPEVFTVELDEDDGVPYLPERIRVWGGPGLRVAVDGQALRNERQRRQRRDRMDAAAADVEGDRIGPR